MLVTPNAPPNFDSAVDSIERTHNAFGMLIARAGRVRPSSQIWTANRATFEYLRNIVQSFRGWLDALPDDKKRVAQAAFKDFAETLYWLVRRTAESATARSPYIDVLPPLILDVVRGFAPAARIS